MNPPYLFHAYGLTFGSELDFPGLETGRKHPDVSIRYGRVPEALPDAPIKGLRFHASPRQFLLRVDGIARYLATEGQTILIDPLPGADHADLRTFLINPVLGALLQQRGVFLLNGAAMTRDNDGVVFAGQSGTGKSTLAAACLQHGYALLTDDICAITVSGEGAPLILPGLPVLRLWADSLEMLGFDKRPLEKQRRRLEKYMLPAAEHFHTEPVPFRCLYILGMQNNEGGKTAEIHDRAARLAAIRGAQFQNNFVADPNVKIHYFKQCVNLSRQVDVNRLDWTINSFQKDTLFRFIREAMSP